MRTVRDGPRGEELPDGGERLDAARVEGASLQPEDPTAGLAPGAVSRVVGRALLVAVASVAAMGCGPRGEAPSRPAGGDGAAPADGAAAATPIAVTPNGFLGRGVPTFVVGTAGDARSDRAIAGQVALIHDLLFPGAPVVADSAIDATRPGSWPERPVVYGGPHVNQLVAQLAPGLPFELRPGELVLGEHRFTGDDLRLIAVVPAREADGRGPARAELLLYAGTGTPGIAEINAVSRGDEPVLVADAFGPLLAGRFIRGADGTIAFSAAASPARRIAWRAVERRFPGARGQAVPAVSFRFPAGLASDPGEDALIEASLRGLERAAGRLAIAAPAPLTFYVYPDAASKRSLTGDAGHGHAVVSARALHVLRAAPAQIEHLVAHEGAHALVYEAWGPAGTPLLGEGVAVWASGAYQGQPLAAWRARLSAPPPVTELLGRRFRALPEAQAYPLAGLFVEAAVGTVGLAGVREHLLGATAKTWPDACAAAGSSPEELQRAFARALER